MKTYHFDQHDQHLNALKYVAKALHKNSTQEYFNYIYSNGVDIVATDGQRLHMYTPGPEEFPLPAGYYKIISNGKKDLILIEQPCDLQYPNYSQVIEHTGNKTGVPQPRLAEALFAEIIHSFGVNSRGTVNYKYLVDAYDETIMYYQTSDSNRPVFLYGDQVMALIMPLKYNTSEGN